MEAHAQHHHALPTGGGALNGLAVSATLHCLTGCAIGEIAGMAIGTALGFSNLATIVLAIALAFVFGYSLTSLPLLRAGLAVSAVVPIALASDTLSIATMEIVDNAILLVVPGAMEAHLTDLLFWGALSFALAIAFVLTVPVNRWLLARGKGHAAVHETGIHGGPPVKLVGAVVALAAIFGTIVVADRALGGGESTHGGGEHGAPAPQESHGGPVSQESHGDEGHEQAPGAEQGSPPGLAVASNGLELELDQARLPLGDERELGFRIVDAEGTPVTDFDLEHARRMHLIVVRRDLTGFQHLHPRIGASGRWSVPVTLRQPGAYRVFADFSHEQTKTTLGADLTVDGDADYQPLAPPADRARIAAGYELRLDAGSPVAGSEAELRFELTRRGDPVAVEPYLGADGHLVALREGDLAFLHVHPTATDETGRIAFAAELPSAGSYRLFLQFRDRGEIRTAGFTLDVDR